MLPVLAGMAALGLARGMMDQKRASKERKQEAEIARYSPWTGMQAQRVKDADILGSTMQGAMGGAMIGQAMGGGGGGAAAAATPAAGGAADAGGMGLTGGGAPPPLDPSAAGAYQATPAAGAMQGGNFQNYYGQQMTSPWLGMR